MAKRYLLSTVQPTATPPAAQPTVVVVVVVVVVEVEVVEEVVVVVLSASGQPSRYRHGLRLKMNRRQQRRGAQCHCP